MVDFKRRFESAEVLEELMHLGGSALTAEEVLALLRDGAAAGKDAREVIPTLFPSEPHFPDPSLAAQLYGNLLGLWDLVASGRPFTLHAPPPRPKAVKPKATPPPSFGESGPDGGFVEAAWRYLEDASPRDVTRLSHAFENRQDALLGHLDEAGLSDNGYATARHLLFELFAMIELGWPPGVRSVGREELLAGSGVGSVPEALQAYADEALFEAEQDEQAPVPPQEVPAVREVVRTGLRALWAARNPT